LPHEGQAGGGRNPAAPAEYRISNFFSHLLKKLNGSRPAVKTDGNFAAFDNHGDLARTAGVLQHHVELAGIRRNVEIFNILILFGISFTSCPRIGSGIFAKNQYFFRHGSILPACAWLTIIII